MRFRLTSLLLALSLLFVFGTANASNFEVNEAGMEFVDGGGGKEDKKEKDDESQAKMKKRRAYNPKKHAKASAKAARQASQMKQKQIMYRASVRNFFHKVFNSKPGKYRNFRSKRQRNRWRKGK